MGCYARFFFIVLVSTFSLKCVTTAEGIPNIYRMSQTDVNMGDAVVFMLLSGQSSLQAWFGRPGDMSNFNTCACVCVRVCV